MRLWLLSLVSLSFVASCAAPTSVPSPVAPPAPSNPPVAAAAPSVDPPAPAALEPLVKASAEGWELSGAGSSGYSVRPDAQAGREAWLLSPRGDTENKYATWMRHIEAAPYVGKRLRISATTKTEGASGRVDLWSRAQAADSPPDGPGLDGDHVPLPPTSGWATVTMTIDVPKGAAFLEYGVGLAGPGRMWLGATEIDVVGDVLPKGPPPKPVAAGGWILAGDDRASFAASVDKEVKHGGHASGSLMSIAPHPRGFGTLMQTASATSFLGKRVRFSAYVRTDGVAGWSGLWLRVDGRDDKMRGFDNMGDRPLTGSNAWRKLEIVLDVAPDASDLAFGVLLQGTGNVWLDDAKLEVVPETVPTTKGRNLGPPANLSFEE